VEDRWSGQVFPPKRLSWAANLHSKGLLWGFPRQTSVCKNVLGTYAHQTLTPYAMHGVTPVKVLLHIPNVSLSIA